METTSLLRTRPHWRVNPLKIEAFRLRHFEVKANMIVDLVDGMVWLTISDLNGEDTVVHGVFSSKEYAERCAAEVGESYPKRAVSAG